MRAMPLICQAKESLRDREGSLFKFSLRLFIFFYKAGDAFERFGDILTATSQYGAIEALRNCDDDVKAMFEEYAARREMIYQGLVDIGLTVFKPKGAFYIFPDISCTGMDDEEFCDRLLSEEKVGVVPGTCFGPQGKNHIRISYAASRIYA